MSSTAIEVSPILPLTSRSTLREVSKDSGLPPIFTISIESILVCRLRTALISFTDFALIDTPLEESIPALDEIRKAGKTKYIGLSECSAATLHKANSSQPFSSLKHWPLANLIIVAKIDAVQAEYSAFETVHELDGLIQTAKDLGVAYVAYSPLGHGWLVDDFPYKSPDDFAPDDFRRSGEWPPHIWQHPARHICW